MEKAKRGKDICTLSALMGIKRSQYEIRNGYPEAVFDLVRHYQELPARVAERLSELAPELIGEVIASQGQALPGGAVHGLGSDAAFGQVIRAANLYREQLGYRPLGPDGWPDGKERES